MNNIGFGDNSTLEQHYRVLCYILTEINNNFKKSNKTTEEKDKLAETCEKFTKLFPIMFKQNMTRKMHLLSMICPDFLRHNDDYFKIYKVEQKGVASP